MSSHASTSPSLPGRRPRVQHQKHNDAGLDVPTLDPLTLAIVTEMRTMREDFHARFDDVTVRLTAVEHRHHHQPEHDDPVDASIGIDPAVTVANGRRASTVPVHPPPGRNRPSAETAWSPALLEDRFVNTTRGPTRPLSVRPSITPRHLPSNIPSAPPTSSPTLVHPDSDPSLQVSSSCAAAPTSATAAPATWEDVLLEMRSFQMKMATARRHEATLVPTSIEEAAALGPVAPSCIDSARDNAAPTTFYSGASVALSSPAPAPPLVSRAPFDRSSNSGTVISPVGLSGSTCADSLVGRSSPSMDTAVVPPTSPTPSCASDYRLQQQCGPDARSFTARPSRPSDSGATPVPTSFSSTQSAATALQRVGDALYLLRARRHVSGVATAMIAVERMREAWRRARDAIDFAVPSFVKSGVGVGSGSRPPPFRAVVEDPFNQPAAVTPIKTDACTHHASHSSLFALDRSVPNTLQSLPALSDIASLQGIYHLHASFTALSSHLLNLVSTTPLPLLLSPARTFPLPHHAQLLPHLLGQFCSAPLPIPVR